MSINAFVWNAAQWNEAADASLLVANMRVYRAFEGPQIVVQWDDPPDTDEVAEIRLVRQLRHFSLNETDGVVRFIASDFDIAPTFFADIGFLSRVSTVGDDFLTNNTGSYTPGALIGSDLVPNIGAPLIRFPIIANTATSITVAVGSTLKELAQPGDEYTVDPLPPDESPQADTIYYYTMWSKLLDDSFVAGPSTRGKALALKTGFFQFKMWDIAPPPWRQLDRRLTEDV